MRRRLERCKEHLRRGLPPDATQFDRVCFQAMANFLWAHCADVESSDDTLSGAWRVKGTRVPVQGVLDNGADGFTAEQIAREIYDLDVETVRRILAFAADRSSRHEAELSAWHGDTTS